MFEMFECIDQTVGAGLEGEQSKRDIALDFVAGLIIQTKLFLRLHFT